MEQDICMLSDELKSEEDIAEIKYCSYYKEPKIDGIRALWVDGRLVNRRGMDITTTYSHIKIDNKDTIVDGEIAFKVDGVFNFNEGRKKENWNKCEFVIFDVLKFEGEKIINKPLIERKNRLKLIKGNNICSIDSLYLSCSNEGYMLKNPNAVYSFGRSKEWIKVKYIQKMTADFTNYEQNTDGSLTCSNELGYRVKVGRDMDIIKKEIDTDGKISLEVNYLEKTENGLLRQVTYSKIAGIAGEINE